MKNNKISCIKLHTYSNELKPHQAFEIQRCTQTSFCSKLSKCLAIVVWKYQMCFPDISWIVLSVSAELRFAQQSLRLPYTKIYDLFCRFCEIQDTLEWQTLNTVIDSICRELIGRLPTPDKTWQHVKHCRVLTTIRPKATGFLIMQYGPKYVPLRMS